MAKVKLSEFLKQNNIALEDIEDDELNLSIPEVRKRLRENQTNYTKGQEELGAHKKRAEEAADIARQWKEYGEGLATELQGLKAAAEKRAGEVARQGGDWRRDPLFQELVGDFDHVAGQWQEAQKGLEQSRAASQALAKGVVALWQYAQDKVQQVEKYLGQLEVERMQGKHKDFNEEKVREYAKKHGINSWQAAYEGWRGENVDSKIEETQRTTREETMREAEGKVNAPPTEMGGGRPAPNVGGEKKSDYKDSWGGLVDELKTAGIS